MRQTRVA